MEYIPDVPEEQSFTVQSILENYGWYLLILGIGLAYIYSKWKPNIDQDFKNKEDMKYAEKYHKDPDLLAARFVAQQAIAQKLQEKYKKDAEVYQQKMEEKEARKREAWLEKNSQNSGIKLGTGNKKTSNLNESEAKTFRPEYNPLMGHGSGSGYRPQRRSPCSGGGCG